MKRFISILIIAVLLCALPFAARAEEELAFTPPDKIVYTVGEAPDYTGGQLAYGEYIFLLSEENCTGLETFLPGIKTVTVSVMTDAPKVYFPIVVLSEEEPILQMKDITDAHWSYSAFGAVMKAGLFTGDDIGTLRPDAPITRAEMAALIYRSWKNDPQVMVTDHPNAAAPFSDVSPDAWYYDEVEALRLAGILRGNDLGQCLPTTNITREDAVLMLMRIQYTDQEMAAIDIDSTIAESGVSPADFSKVSSYAKNAVALALGSIIKGDQNNCINPQNPITRAETATIFHRMFFEGYTWEPPVVEQEKPNPEEMPLIFLSPSTQFENQYTGVDTTEGIQMNLLAEVLKQKLEAAGYRVYLPSTETTYKERAELSNQVGADLHIPIHSNAGGGTGTRIFYNGTIPGSKELSDEIFAVLGALTNSNDPNIEYVKDDSAENIPYYEIRVPKAKIAFIEVEFHDIAEKAQWIIDQREALAQAIFDGIDAYCKKHPINKTAPAETADAEG